MKNTQQEKRRRMVVRAENFFQRHSLTEYVQNFLESDDVIEIIHQGYSKQKSKTMILKEMAPEELKERAEELYKIFSEHEDIFKADVIENFKSRVATRFETLPENLIKEFSKNRMLKKFFADGKKSFVGDLREIVENLTDSSIIMYIKKLYDSYVPDHIPDEVANLITELTFGGQISFDGIYSYYEDYIESIEAQD